MSPRESDADREAPRAYTPPRLAERILSSRAELEGERKHVTILFADVKDSMELVASRDPEEARSLLDPVLELMMEAVHRYEGVVNQVMGDGVMAIFGAPIAYEDHAVRACYAALTMRDAIRRYSEQLSASRGLEILARIGLNSGEVVVRAIGSDLKMEYSAIGQATHLAARMEQLAAPGTICVMGETTRLAEGFVQTRPLGRVTVKGVGEPVEIFELVGAGLARTPWQARVTRGLTPFVGRVAELQTLGQAAAWAETGHGQLVAIVGEPGVGKSRLAWEFTRRQREHGWLVVEAAAMSHGRMTAFRPLTDLLRTYFGVDERSHPEDIRDTVARRLQALEPGATSALPAFLDLMRVPFSDESWSSAEPTQRRARMLEAVQRLVLRECRDNPVLLVFEDLHWVDGPTQGVLDQLVGILPAARVMLLITYRPEYRHPWAARDCFAELHLESLPHESAEVLLEALLGTDDSVARLKRLLVDRADGSPFFLEECVRSLVASGALVGQPGEYRLTTELARIEMPVTVQAVLAARIDRLPPADKRLLQTAAVIGRHVSLEMLRAIAELPDAELTDGLVRLQAASFLLETAMFPEPAYMFPHSLIQEVAYRGVLLERRRAVHGRLVDAMERLLGDRCAEQAELLGHHAARGGRWAAAVTYLREAGARAAARSEYPEAVAFLKESLAAAERLPAGAERAIQEIDIRFELRNALWARGRLVEGLDYLRQAEPLAAALGDERRLTRLMAHQSSNYLVLGDNARALECGQETLNLARKLDDFALQVDANQFLGVLSTSLGDFRLALKYLDTSIAALMAEGRPGRFGDFYAVHGRTWRVWCLAELGRFDEAAVSAQEAMQIAEEGRHPHNIVAACWAAGYLDRLRGRVGAATQALERGYALCQSAGVTVWLRPTDAVLGHTYAWAGRLAEATARLERAVRPAENNVGLAAWKVFLAETHLLAGRIDEAAEMATGALTLSRQRQETGFAAQALRTLGAIDARQASTADASDHYGQALELAVERGMLPLAARCHAALAVLEREAGRTQPAAEHQAATDDLCRRMRIDAQDLEPTTHLASS